MGLSPEDWRLRARACRGLLKDVTDPQVAAALGRVADWFDAQGAGPGAARPSGLGPVVPFAIDAEDGAAKSPRAAERIHLRFKAGLRKQGESRFEALIADLSTVGFRVESHYAMPAGSQVFLTLPGLSAISARVVWSRDNALGCRFDAPIHPAVFERVVAAARLSA